MKLNEKELNEVKGGAISLGLGLLIGSAVIFVIGLLDGLIHPKECK